jgi:hypothetical protein
MKNRENVSFRVEAQAGKSPKSVDVFDVGQIPKIEAFIGRKRCLVGRGCTVRQGL